MPQGNRVESRSHLGGTAAAERQGVGRTTIAKMEPRYSNSYVERLVLERDRDRLYQLLSVLARRAILPEELWAFNRMMEWLGSTRSGVWQYYEGIPEDVFARLRNWLLRVGWQELHARYTEGMAELSAGGNCAQLDRWLDEHDEDIVAALWHLVAPQIGWLKTTAGAG